MICKICNNKFNIIKKGTTRKYCYKCSPTFSKKDKKSHVKRQIIFRQAMKQRGLELLGNECQICGYKGSPASLEFHHINRKTKKYNFSDSYTSWETYKLEIKKCILMCSNCHAEVHWQENQIYN